MRNARTAGAIAAAIMLLPACHKSQDQQAQDQTMAIDEGVPQNQVAGNAEIETLPPDESSATPSNQLQNGFDNPDVNDLGTTNS